MDEKLLESALTKWTKAIVPMHYVGVGCEMDSTLEIALKYDLIVVEDAAQGVNANYRDRYLGTIGHLGTYSFHETKNFISGESGALVINNERFIEPVEIIREKGTNRSKFFREKVHKYTWVDVGSSYLPSEMVAAVLYAQLEEAETITRKRLTVYNYNLQQLAPLQDHGLIRLPQKLPECVHNAHMFYILVSTSLQDRD